MKIEQKRWTAKDGWEINKSTPLEAQADLVLVFAGHAQLTLPNTFEDLKRKYPQAILFGCSTAGEICATQVTDESIVLTAIKFEHTILKTASIEITAMEDSYEVGQKLMGMLDKEGLRHVLVLSDGLNINGSALVHGIADQLPKDVTITGGLSGDAGRFEKTYVLTTEGVKTNHVAVVGFYGSRLVVGYSSLGGWDPFGPERIVTKSKGNILYELDGQSALELYKTYLGEHAAGLPATGLLFPLTIRNSDKDEWVVRTILAVNEEDGSMTFAGDIPLNTHARLMRANFERLIDGASGAAKNIVDVSTTSPELAILISCVGRKMILKQRIEEEVEAVQEIFGGTTFMTGFYSYGEISPFTPNAKCELHNQTMTITTLSEQ